MWDLNADMSSTILIDDQLTEENHSNHHHHHHHHHLTPQQRSQHQLSDDSVTSTSSIVILNNAVHEEYQSNGVVSHALFTFDLFNSSSSSLVHNRNIDDVAGTSSFKANERKMSSIFEPMISRSVSTPAWLNLSFSESADRHEEEQRPQTQIVPVKKSRRGPRSRSSQYRGVTFYRRTGRWESHIWDCGKQVYLGGFDTAHAAARAYDRAAIKFRGEDADINFSITDYLEDATQMKNLSKEEFVHILRRQSTGFARGSSKYRGVTLHKCGRWEARMGQLLGKKYMYLGLFDTEVEAARAYDVAALRCNGSEAATNFEPSTYDDDMSLQAKNNPSGYDLNLSLTIDSESDYNQIPNEPSSSTGNSMGVEQKFVYSTSANGTRQIPPHSEILMPQNKPSMYRGTAIHSGTSSSVPFEVQYIKRPSELSAPKWGWQHTQGHGSTSKLPTLSSAASSGFSLSSSSPSSFLTPATSQASQQLLQQRSHGTSSYQNNYPKS